MEIQFDEMVRDVMGRMGEVGIGDEPREASAMPTVFEVVAAQVGRLLPQVAERLLREAPIVVLGEGEEVAVGDVTLRRMPCGEMAAEVPLPEGLVRVVAIKMAGWEREVCDVTLVGTPGWECQWSREAGIAGTAGRPRAYLGAGRLRLVGVGDDDGEIESLRGWQLPAGDSFRFPGRLYSELVNEIVKGI